MNKATGMRGEDIKAGSDSCREAILSSGNEARYREIFEHVPVSIWIEDWSRVKTMIDGLARRGVKD